MHRSCYLLFGREAETQKLDIRSTRPFFFAISFLLSLFPIFILFHYQVVPSSFVFRRYQSTKHATPSHSFSQHTLLTQPTQCSRTHRSSEPSSSSPRSSPSSPPSRATRTTTSPHPPRSPLLLLLRVVSATPARRTAASRCIRAIATRSRAPLDLLDCLFLERAVSGLIARA